MRNEKQDQSSPDPIFVLQPQNTSRSGEYMLDSFCNKLPDIKQKLECLSTISIFKLVKAINRCKDRKYVDKLQWGILCQERKITKEL